MVTKLQAQAAALRAVNSAKHKAAGKTHRTEVHSFSARGRFVQAHVFYTVGVPDVLKLAQRIGTRCLSATLASSQVEAI